MIDSFFGKYRFLSNFYPSIVEFEGLHYPTIEHAFQAAKTFDSEERVRIAQMDTPNEAKRAGRRVKLRQDWEDVKIDIMTTLVRTKFSEETMKEDLLATEDQELIEGNTWGDKFWGVCGGEGRNELGKILMEVRSELK